MGSKMYTHVKVGRTEMEHDHGQELVKCVLVGDTAVGKTRLICGRACNARASLRQLFTTHVPTVFAIDQYRMYKEVLERSMSFVDDVHVSLRLWDTFGDHEKDRRFAYGRSDVILLCFSIASRNSLQHCKTMWFPEIRRFCPDTPVILVGCKNDLRFLVNDPAYAECCRERSPFFRPIRESDLVMADQARTVAKEIGIPYYETSVYTYYGVDQVFENAIRSALLARRRQRFWMTNLKHVRQPLLQAPYCPPKKEITCIPVCAGDYWTDVEKMMIEQEFPDLVFLIGNSELFANRFVLEAGAKKLMEFLQVAAFGMERRYSETSSTTSDSTTGEEECLLGHDPDFSTNHHLPRLQFSTTQNNTLKPDNTDSISGCSESLWNLIQSVRLEETENDTTGSVQIRIQMRTNTLSVQALSAYLHYVYLGELPRNTPLTLLPELRRLAESFESLDFGHYLTFWGDLDKTMMTRCTNLHHAILPKSMWRNCQLSKYTDVVFELDDGTMEAHRGILANRSDVMRAMFSGDFLEKHSRVVTLPGVKTEVFRHFLEYIYMDKLESQNSIDTSMLLIELANRLCLPRLINLIESILIPEIRRMESSAEVLENCIRIVESAQLHNAERLAEFCMIFIATNYDDISRNHGKLFKELDPENRQWVLQNRWPPVWYVKDLDYYHKALKERYKLETDHKKSRKRSSSGCLCFSSKASRRGRELPVSRAEIKGITDASSQSLSSSY